jgi:uncharacterized protein (TIGR00730 family)
MTDPRNISRVCVYCASSKAADPVYLQAACRLGELLAENSISIVYGGSAAGCMGRLAEGALARGGCVIGVLPRFMQELEWGHSRLTEMHIVEDMRERKHRMLTGADAVIALPGGCGTLEELLEAITLKRLGIYLNPIVLVNTRGFFDPLMDLLQRAVAERFMNAEHGLGHMWHVVEGPEQVLPAIRAAAPWPANARDFAAVRSS